MERHLRELWTPFNGGGKSFFELVPEFFAGMITMLDLNYKIDVKFVINLERQEGQQVPALKPGPKADHALDSR
jgi:hypothetical protein